MNRSAANNGDYKKYLADSVCPAYRKDALETIIKTYKKDVKKAPETVRQELATLWDQCISLCSREKASFDDALWCRDDTKLSRMAASTSQNTCPKGKKSQPNLHENNFLFPLYSIKLGFSASRASFSFLEEMDESEDYTPQEVKHTSWKFGGSFSFINYEVGIPTFPLTVEALFLVEFPWTPNTQKLHWCVPGETINPTGETDAETVNSETCKDTIKGGPEGGSYSILAKFLLGGVDTDKGFWRISGGPSFSWNNNTEKLSIGLELPVFLNFSTAIVKGRYSGLLRIAPAIQYYPNADDDESTWQALLVLSVLGQRNMFSPNYDSL